MHKILIFAGLLIILSAPVEGQINDSLDTGAIWFKETETIGKRFMYSQTILWPSSIAGHIGLYIAKDNFDWSRAVRWSMYQKTFTSWPAFDRDHWSWNYEVHPYMGSISYLTYRNRHAPVWEAVLGTSINSLIYEYLIAGGTQPASLNDLIVTPIAGSLLGEGLYQLKKTLLRDRYLSTFEKVLLVICDPVESFYFGFDFKKMARYTYR